MTFRDREKVEEGVEVPDAILNRRRGEHQDVLEAAALEHTEQGLVFAKRDVADVRAMVRDGGIQDAASVAALSLALGAFEG